MVSSETIRQELQLLIRNFEAELHSADLRRKVRCLVPVVLELRKLGKSLIPADLASSARSRILHYLREYPRTVIDGDELHVVSSIQDYPRRVRELRVEHGWSIATGVSMREFFGSGETVPVEFLEIKPDQYVLLDEAQDRDAAHRWNLANSIRREHGSSKDKIIKYMLENIGRPISGEELRYVCGNRTEWARRVRELRSEHGWAVATQSTGRPDLPVGMYVLESNRQSPEHDRVIPDEIRRSAMRRDGYSCTKCQWSHDDWNPSDPRHLELHHVSAHVSGGLNTYDNLITLCSSCHDVVHRQESGKKGKDRAAKS